MSAQLLAVTNAPNQAMNIGLRIDGVLVSLSARLSYNRVGGFWVLDLNDLRGNPVLTSIPLLTGDWPGANILGPFSHLKIGSWYVINQSGAATDWPNASNLGSGFVILVDDTPVN